MTKERRWCWKWNTSLSKLGLLPHPVMKPSAMADDHRQGRSSLSPCLPSLLVLLLLLCSPDAAQSLRFDFPTGGLSTGWVGTLAMERVIKFGNRTKVSSPLLRRSREGFGPTYACGFCCYNREDNYRETSCNSSFVFAVFIVQTNSSGDILLAENASPMLVWAANRDGPVGENATLQLGSDGDLVLTDANGTKVWSTNTSGNPVAGMNLTEYGNLVLFGGDNNQTIFWDSFDYPTDSLVPGQKLRVGQSLISDSGYYCLCATSTWLILGTSRCASNYLEDDSTRKTGYFVFMNGSISTSSSGQYMQPSQFLQLKNYGWLRIYEWNSTSTGTGWDSSDLLTETGNNNSVIGFYPTAGLSTMWASSPRTEPVVRFSDGSQVIPLLLGGSRKESGPVYACGFYCSGGGDSFLFGIFIVHANNAGGIVTISADGSPQVVWMANRGRPVSENATLQLDSYGDLVLTDADMITKVWSSNTSGKSVVGMYLSEFGNLVLFGGNENRTIWESFAYPTDSLVPGQKLRLGQSLTANLSAINSTEGLYYLYANSTGLISFFKSEPPTRYAQLPLTSEKKIEYFEFMNGSITSTSSGQYLPTSQFLRLDFDGHLRVYEWRPRADTKWAVVKDLLLGWNYSTATRCSYPTVCGRYGICSGNEQCSCPQWDDVGDSNYFVQVDGRRPNSGCKEVAPVSCQSPYNDTKLLRLDDVGYFTYFDQYFSYPGKGVDIRETSESGCRHLCEKNCSCKAAFFSPSAPFGSCFLAFEVFSMMNMQDDDDSWVSRLGYKSTAFIKVQIPVSPAKSARSTDPVNGSAKRPGKPKGAILGSTLGTSFLLIFVVGSVIFIAALKKRYTAAEDEEDDLEQVSGMPRRFSFEELRVATDGFCKKLGRGGFGSVYEGKIEAKTIAVKRLESVGQGRKEFLAEVQTIGNIHHVNLVKLIGYCAEKSCRLLVYEFMPNGSLDKWIFSEEQKASLDWQTRSKIILGVAKGLSYLHEDCTQRIAHLDIKPQNILLDDRFEAKVSDFGLAKLIERDQTHVETRMRGTPGYLAPEWLSSMITEKVDVYSFGVVILEIICGRRNLDRSRPEEDVVLLSLLKRKAEKSELQDFVDECIKNTDFHVDEVMKMIKIAMWCLQDANNRPSMSTVVRILEGGMDIESNLEGMFWTCVVECDAANSGSTAPLLASVLSGPR